MSSEHTLAAHAGASAQSDKTIGLPNMGGPARDHCRSQGRVNVAYFSVASISLSPLRKPKPCSLLNAARHNLREIQAEQGSQGHIYPTRTPKNVVLAGPGTAAEVQAIADVTLHSAEKQKLRRDHCQAIEALFSLPPESSVQQENYFRHCLQWLKSTMGLPVLSAVVHNDEAAPHLHVLLLPFKNGKYLGSAPINQAELKKLRTSFFDGVAGPLGLKRERAKLRGSTKELAIKAVLDRLEQMELPDAWRLLWSAIKSAIRRDPLEWLQCLGIDLNAARRGDAFLQPMCTPKPLGFERERRAAEPLTCVGFAQPTASIDLQQCRPLSARSASSFKAEGASLMGPRGASEEHVCTSPRCTVQMAKEPARLTRTQGPNSMAQPQD